MASVLIEEKPSLATMSVESATAALKDLKVSDDNRDANDASGDASTSDVTSPRNDREQKRIPRKKTQSQSKDNSAFNPANRRAFQNIVSDVSNAIRRSCGDVHIYTVESEDEFDKVIGYTDDWKKMEFMGLDCEWDSQDKQGKIALIQICFGRTCILFRLNIAGRMPEKLMDVLEDPSIVKCGVNIAEDIRRFESYKVYVKSGVDLTTLANTHLPNRYWDAYNDDLTAEQSSQTAQNEVSESSSQTGQEASPAVSKTVVKPEAPKSPKAEETGESATEKPEDEEAREKARQEFRERRRELQRVRREQVKKNPLCQPWKSLSMLSQALIGMDQPKRKVKYTFHDAWNSDKPLDDAHIMYAAKDAIASLHVFYAVCLVNRAWNMFTEGRTRKIRSTIESAFEGTRYSSEYHVYDIVANQLTSAKNCYLSTWFYNHCNEMGNHNNSRKQQQKKKKKQRKPRERKPRADKGDASGGEAPKVEDTVNES